MPQFSHEFVVQPQRNRGTTEAEIPRRSRSRSAATANNRSFGHFALHCAASGVPVPSDERPPADGEPLRVVLDTHVLLSGQWRVQTTSKSRFAIVMGEKAMMILAFLMQVALSRPRSAKSRNGQGFSLRSESCPPVVNFGSFSERCILAATMSSQIFINCLHSALLSASLVSNLIIVTFQLRRALPLQCFQL